MSEAEETYFDKLRECPRCRMKPKVQMKPGHVSINCNTIVCPIAIDDKDASWSTTLDAAIEVWNKYVLQLWLRRPVDIAMVKSGLKRWKDGEEPAAI